MVLNIAQRNTPKTTSMGHILQKVFNLSKVSSKSVPVKFPSNLSLTKRKGLVIIIYIKAVINKKTNANIQTTTCPFLLFLCFLIYITRNDVPRPAFLAGGPFFFFPLNIGIGFAPKSIKAAPTGFLGCCNPVLTLGT